MIQKYLSLPLAAAACLAFATVSPAQTTYTWNGGAIPDSNWSNGLNWGGTAPPTDTSTTGTLVVLGGSNQLTNTLDYNLGVNSLSFASGAGSFVVGSSGGSVLTIGSGGIAVNGSNAQTINAAIALAANQTWTSTTTFVTGGAIATGGNNLTIAGAGAVNFYQSLTGGGTLTKTGTGTLNLYKANTNAALTINAGTVNVAPASGVGNLLGTGQVTLGSGTLAFRNSIALSPVSITAGSFNRDTIVALSDPATAPFGTNSGVDNTGAGGYAFYEMGRNTNNTSLGLPSSGFLTSITSSNQTYQLQSFTANNTVQLNSGAGLLNGTLTFTTPAQYAQLNLLAVTGNGGTAVGFTAVVNFTDSSSQTYTGQTTPDWFNGANPVIQGLDRMNRGSGNFDNNTTNPRMYAVPLILSAGNQAKLVSSIGLTLTTTGSQVLDVYGVSGGLVPGFVGVPGTQSYANPIVQTANSSISVDAGLSVQFSSVNTGGFNLSVVGNGNAVFPNILGGGGTLTRGAGSGQLTISAANTQTTTVITGGTLFVAPSAAGVNPLNTGPVNMSGGTLSFKLTSNPIPLTTGSFNRDVVIALTDPSPANAGNAPFGTNASVDAGNPGYAFYEAGVIAAGGGLPNSLTFTAANNPAQSFVLQPYTGNNALVLSSTNGLPTAGTITLSTATSFSSMSLLVTSGSGASTFDAVLHFGDGSSTTFTGLTSGDWFGGANFVIGGLGRVNRSNGGVDGLTTDPRLYTANITLSAADQAKTVTSIGLTETSTGQVLNVFGLAGAAPGVVAQTYSNPINVTGGTSIEVLNIPAVTFNSLLSINGSTLNVTTSNSAGLTITNGISMSGNPTFNVNAGSIFSTGALNANSAARNIGQAGTGTWNLTGSGTNFVNGSNFNFNAAGIINLLSANSFGVGTTAVTQNATSVINLSAAQSFASLNGNNVGAFVNLGGNALTLSGTNNANTTFNGRITGTAGVSVTGGTGSQTLNNMNTYSGVTTVSGGKVVSVMPGSLGTGAVSLGSGTLVLTGIEPAGGTTTTLGGFTAVGTGAGQYTSAGSTTPLPTISGGVATMTTAVNNQGHSLIYNNRVPLNQNFSLSFRYSQSNNVNPADGLAFVIMGAQPGSFGGAGGSLGYVGIPGPSFAFAINTYGAAAGGGQGIGVTNNGNTATPYYASAFPDILNAQAGREIYINLSYDATLHRFSGTFGQALTSGGTVFNFPISDADGGPIPASPATAGTATTPTLTYDLGANIGVGGYIGFTAGTGGLNTQQTVDQFSFTSGNAVTAYNQSVSVIGGTTGTINVLAKAGAPNLSMTTLTIGAGTTGLTVGADAASVANLSYGLTFGATTLNGDPTFTVANNGTGTGTLTLGALNDAGTARNFTKAGAGSLVLGSAATSLVAGTQVNVTGGVLTLNNATSIGNTAQLNAAASTVVNFNASATVAALTGAGSANIGANTLTIGNASNLSGAFSGVIAGAGGSIVKAGSGTLTLAGANTYSGTTSVNAGTLVVNNTTGAGTGSGITSLASGTTLMGTGRLGGGLTVNTGAFLAPGNSIGTLSANAGTTTLAAGGTYTVEYDHSGGVLTPGTTIDYFNSAGSLSVTAGNTAGNTFIINLKYTGPVGGGFSSPVSVNIATFGAGTTGSGFASDRFTITGDIVGSASTLTMDASNNLVLTFTPVPEPVTVLGLAAGAIGLAGFARRRYFRAA